MGLSIQYSGKFSQNASLSEMIDEVKDIAEIYKWKFVTYKTEFPENSFNSPYNNKIYGLSFTPSNCEPIMLGLLSNGRLSSPANLQFYGKSDTQEEDSLLYQLSTKTHFAGVELHIIIIHLLKYLKNKYFEEFTVIDESGFWNNEDEELLIIKFKQNIKLMDNFTFGLEYFPINDNEAIEDYLVRLLKQIRNKKGNA